MGNVLHSSDSNEWYTPKWVLKDSLKVIGQRRFSLDPAASEVSMAEVNGELIRNFYTAADDGLAQKWTGDIWLNPPYGGMAKHFIDKALEELDEGRIRTASILVNPKTETQWFRPLWNCVLVFFNKRIKFIDPITLEEQASPPHGNVLAFMIATNEWSDWMDLYYKAKSVFGGLATIIPPQGLLEYADGS